MFCLWLVAAQYLLGSIPPHGSKLNLREQQLLFDISARSIVIGRRWQLRGAEDLVAASPFVEHLPSDPPEMHREARAAQIAQMRAEEAELKRELQELQRTDPGFIKPAPRYWDEDDEQRANDAAEEGGEEEEAKEEEADEADAEADAAAEMDQPDEEEEAAAAEGTDAVAAVAAAPAAADEAEDMDLGD